MEPRGHQGTGLLPALATCASLVGVHPRSTGWHRCTVAGALGLVLALAAGIARGDNSAASRQRGVLADGSIVELEGVTEGLRHTWGKGSWMARWTSGLPEMASSKWTWLDARVGEYRETRATFSRSHLVLWFTVTGATGTPRVVSSNHEGRDRPPRILPSEAGRIRMEFLRWTVSAPDGTRHGGTVSRSVPVGAGTSVLSYPVPLDSFPRRQRTFAVDLWQPWPASTNEVVHVGSFSIVNPRVAQEEEWSQRASPQEGNANLPGCFLVGFRQGELGGVGPADLPGPTPEAKAHRHFRDSFLFQEVERRLGITDWSGHGGSILFHWRGIESAALAEFRIVDPSASERRWELNRFELVDPVGNVSHALFHDWTATAPGEWRLRCWTIPLWKDDPVWRIRLDLVADGPWSTNRVVRLTGLAFPPPPGSSTVVHETNWMGARLQVRCLGADDPLVVRARFRIAQAYPRLALDFDGTERSRVTGHSPEVRWLGVRDAAGGDVGIVDLFRDEFGDPERWVAGFRGTAFQSERTNPPTFRLDVTFGFPEERHFEFAVRSTVGGR